MFSLRVHAVFSAAHAIILRGEREPLHGHNWHVEAVVQGQRLDAEGLLCDFHAVEQSLRDAIAPFHNRSLNVVPPFADEPQGTRKPENRRPRAIARTTLNPTAENVAQVIAMTMHSSLSKALPPTVKLASVSVTEAPGCIATFFL